MKLKKSKRITIALSAMLLAFSTAATLTGTVAWFTAANVVSVSGMNIQAEAENGIVIANEGKSEWKTDVVASHNGKVNDSTYHTFIPTSTKDATAWYHGNASDANSYAGTSSAFTVAESTGTSGTGIGSIDLNQYSEDPNKTALNKNIYLLNHFYIQASAASPLTGQGLYVKELNAAARATPTSDALDKSLRVLFKLGTGNAVIYAPLATGDKVEHDGSTVANGDGHGGHLPGSTTTIPINKNAAIDDTDAYDKLYQGDIPAYNAAGTGALDLSVYIYFEGEDFNCKSANIKNALDGLAVDFKLENK